MTEELQFKIERLPDSPGCYLMKSGGQIIYVGKAKNLKNRVRQYFNSPKAHTPKVRAMVDKVDDFDIVLVSGELEALMLECNLIKLHRPYYNILLKDDKQYPYIAIDLKEPFPRVRLKRQIEHDGLKYFGPYKSASVVREVLDATRTVFPIRVCDKVLNPNKVLRPCVHHATGQCLAPCAGLVGQQDYLALIKQVTDFLSGKYEPILGQLTARMQEAAAQLNYERAALYRDRIQAVENVMERQRASTTQGADQDVLATSPEGVDALVECLSVREGKLVDAQTYTMPRSAEEAPGEVITSFLLQHYGEGGQMPREILLPCTLPEQAVLEQLLYEACGHRVHLHAPERGEKKRLIDLAAKNLADAMSKRAQKLAVSYARTLGACKELAQAIGMEQAPRRIEGYDISNTQGVLSVASMVVMIDGTCQPREYRHFRIKTVEGANDFASMHEVITRRLQHGLEELAERSAQGLPARGGKFSDLPDLILIDGGAQQLAFAQDAMHALGLNIPMFGLAKRLEEIVLPDRADTILLDRHSEALHLIQRLRDEAHRFGITHHRKLRAKASIASSLDDIPGVGPKKKRALLKHFKTVEALRSADMDALCQAEGIGPALARVVYAHYHGEA